MPIRNDTLRLRLLAAASTAGIWALAVWATGGIHVEPFGIRISSSDPKRPLIVACVLFGTYAALWPQAFRSHFREIGVLLARRRPAWIAGAIACAVLGLAVWFGVAVAGSADVYGYVSQAALWRQGRLVVPIDLIARVPWSDPQWTFAPLGYRPSALHADAIVPTYAAGLPLAMAAMQLLAGYGGAFLVVPLSGALLIWLTYALGRRLFDSPGVALWAATLVAVSPAFLFQVMWPMSDVPVAAAWTAALVLAAAGRPFAAGLAMSAALTIRPNLVLLPASLVVWRLSAGAPAFAERFEALWMSAGVLPGVALVAALNRYLYGSPFSSGYGEAAGIFQIDRAATNAAHYGTWLLETQTPLVLLAAVFFVAPRWCVPTRIRFPRLLLGGTLAATVGSYLFYEVFTDWWYLRFLLPMWPALMLCVAAGIDGMLRRWLAWLRPIALAAAVVFLAFAGLHLAIDRAIFGLGRGERRYVDVARYVAAHTEPGAVILSMQHSGSIRLYAGRMTLRYDMLAEGALDPAVAYLTSIGRHPYIVVERWELEQFRRKHAATSRLGRLDWKPLARLEGWNDVALYDAAAPAAPVRTEAIPPLLLEAGFMRPPAPHSGAGVR